MKKISLLFLLFAFFSLAAEQIVQQVNLGVDDTNCPNGGILVLVGEDNDSNEALEGEEIKSSAYICEGENGCDVVATVSNPSSSYSKCNGNTGILISSGADCDSNGNIDAGQAMETVLCYGANGNEGGWSTAGGQSGNGANGKNGKTPEFIITNEPAGDNCAAGGIKVENRLDTNGNGEFEDSEITVDYICDGESPQGSQGQPGDQGLAGIDGKDGADGAKGERGDQGEQGEPGIAGEPGENGADGYDSLVSATDEPAGENCANGGKKFVSGIDTDRNGVLDESEIKNSYYICNGENAVEASEEVTSSGCTITTISSDENLDFISSLTSAVYSFLSNIF